MLCFILTDAFILPSALKRALKDAVYRSFNSITVDGCMSTNDMVLILANGLAKNKCIEQKDKSYLLFSGALKDLCLEIAKDIVRDAEGATKFIKITVKGADSEEKAKRIALSIANSNLFKSAMYGEDRNLGRIVSAIGQSRTNVREEAINIRMSDLKEREINLEVLVGKGKGIATVYTSDLTPEYVKINAKYS
jgi:glutamate N-acetyltransferase/amino-acid N-acetyltransferase